MAKLKKVEETTEEVVEEVKPKKKTTKKRTVKKEKTRKEIQMELRKVAKDTLVEITNISYMESSYYSKMGDEYFKLQPGEYCNISLAELEEVVRNGKGFFTSFSIIVTDVLSNDVSLKDVMRYLGLDNVFKNIEDANEDFIEEILEMDDDEFEDTIDLYSGKQDIVKNIAARGVYMTRSDDYDYELSRRKNRILAKQFGRNTLFDEDLE